MMSLRQLSVMNSVRSNCPTVTLMPGAEAAELFNWFTVQSAKMQTTGNDIQPIESLQRH